jgi:hypothetical protein
MYTNVKPAAVMQQQRVTLTRSCAGSPVYDRDHVVCGSAPSRSKAEWVVSALRTHTLEHTSSDYGGALQYTAHVHTRLSNNVQLNLQARIPMAQKPLVSQDLLVIEASGSLWHNILGRAPLDEWSARRTDLYLTTHNTHKRQTSMPLAKFEPTVPASAPPKTHILDRAATEIGEGRYCRSRIRLQELWTTKKPCQLCRCPY